MASPRIDSLYDLASGDEDARVCKDIPAAACHDQPHNFFAYLGANLLSKVADELSSARLILPWLLGALGAPAAFAGFLVPIREAGVLLPQLAVAAYVRHLALRKWVWVAGGVLSALALLAMALAAVSLEGAAAGWVIVAALVVFSLARGLCSVSAKDVLGKTVSKSRRGRLMGLAAGISGVMTLGVGLLLTGYGETADGTGLFAALLLAAVVLWAVAIVWFATIREQPGATEGGGNALTVALQHLDLLRSDPLLRGFVVTRVMLMAVALMPPFFVLLAQEHADGAAGLGMLVIAGGLAASISAPVWGRLGDRSSRRVMAAAAALAGLLGVALWLAVTADAALLASPLTHAAAFLLLTVAHGGVRLGRKVYLVDMATQDNRAALVAVSNTVIGVAMLAAGLVGALAPLIGVAGVVLLLSALSLLAAVRALRLAEVSEP